MSWAHAPIEGSHEPGENPRILGYRARQFPELRLNVLKREHLDRPEGIPCDGTLEGRLVALAADHHPGPSPSPRRGWRLEEDRRIYESRRAQRREERLTPEGAGRPASRLPPGSRAGSELAVPLRPALAPLLAPTRDFRGLACAASSIENGIAMERGGTPFISCCHIPLLLIAAQ